MKAFSPDQAITILKENNNNNDDNNTNESNSIHPFSAILLDLLMLSSSISGLQLAKQLREVCSSPIPIIFVEVRKLPEKSPFPNVNSVSAELCREGGWERREVRPWFKVHKPVRRRVLVEAVHKAVTLYHEKENGNDNKVESAIEIKDYNDTNVDNTNTEIEQKSNINAEITTISNAPDVFSVLVVEDNVVNQKFLMAILPKLGYRCEVANNGQEAIDQIVGIQNSINPPSPFPPPLPSRPLFDVILLDLNMPILDGIETTRILLQLWPDSFLSNRIKQRSKTRPIIIGLTADYGSKNQCLAAGMDSYLTKPINLTSLKVELLRWNSYLKQCHQSQRQS